MNIFKTLIFSILVATNIQPFAVEFIPLDINDGEWEVEMDFKNFMTKEQRSQLNLALAQLEEMKKKNPQMAAQVAKMTAGMGIGDGTIKKKNCLTKNDMKTEMDKMLGQQSKTKKCIGKISKSTNKLIEGSSTCGDKIHNYKITVQDQKHMQTVITTADGKVVKGDFRWLTADCLHQVTL